MIINDGGGTKKKAAPKANPRGNAAFRGGSQSFRDVDYFKKRAEARGKVTKNVQKTKSAPKPKVKPIKPKKKVNPKKPKKTKVVKTTPTPKPVTYNAVSLLSGDKQSAEILNAYLAMAGTELFQYTNSQTIDGMYNDVAIINVLSRRRQAYTPNRLIELAEVFVKRMWVEGGNLCVEIDNSSNLWDQCVLSFTIGTNLEIAHTVA